MPNHPSASRTRHFFIAWLIALVLCPALFIGAHALLSAEHESPFALGAPEGPAIPEMRRPAPAAPIRPFDAAKDGYLVTAFSLQGMQHVTDAEPAFTLLPPGNTLVAQVIRRDPNPEPLLPGNGNAPATVLYSLDYAPDPAFSPDTQTKGTLGGSDEAPWFTNDSISVMPYLAAGLSPSGNGTAASPGDSGVFYAYPSARVVAADAGGTVLMETRVVLPVSTEIGCRNCHTGPWKYNGTAGVSASTAEHILTTHDRRSHTRLAEQAARDKTVDCRSCHSGTGAQPNLSTALHGFHAAMKLEGAEGCGTCHPSASAGATRFNRDLHAMWGLDCTRCHGSMTEHALSLLRFEAERGSQAATSRMAMLQVETATSAKDIQPRRPWINLPQCAGCHDFKKKPDPATASAFNKWTENKNDRFSHAVENTGKLRCPSCHGSPHAVYPADGPAGNDDNAQPLQYQKAAMPLGKDGNCSVCHTVDMDYFVHHDRVE